MDKNFLIVWSRPFSVKAILKENIDIFCLIVARLVRVRVRFTGIDQWLWTNFTRVFQPVPSWLNWPITYNGPDLQPWPSIDKHYSLDSENDFRSGCRNVRVTNNSSFQNYAHPDDHTIRTTDTPGFKPFNMCFCNLKTQFNLCYDVAPQISQTTHACIVMIRWIKVSWKGLPNALRWIDFDSF